MNTITPLASEHFTTNKTWQKISDRVAMGLKIALHPNTDPKTRENLKRRTRKHLEVQATFRANAVFDQSAREIAAMRRHALVMQSKPSGFAKHMN